MLVPGKRVPNFKVKVLENEIWELDQNCKKKFLIIFFYRGLHCPICKVYLQQINSRINEFSALDIDVIAISADSEMKAVKTKNQWDLNQLKIGYEFNLDEAKKYGLYLSRAIKDYEPDVFIEPGLFIVNQDKTLYGSCVQTMPFTRPNLDELIACLKFIIQNNYPSRGEY